MYKRKLAFFFQKITHNKLRVTPLAIVLNLVLFKHLPTDCSPLWWEQLLYFKFDLRADDLELRLLGIEDHFLVEVPQECIIRIAAFKQLIAYDEWPVIFQFLAEPIFWVLKNWYWGISFRPLINWFLENSLWVLIIVDHTIVHSKILQWAFSLTLPWGTQTLGQWGLESPWITTALWVSAWSVVYWSVRVGIYLLNLILRTLIRRTLLWWRSGEPLSFKNGYLIGCYHNFPLFKNVFSFLITWIFIIRRWWKEEMYQGWEPSETFRMVIFADLYLYKHKIKPWLTKNLPFFETMLNRWGRVFPTAKNLFFIPTFILLVRFLTLGLIELLYLFFVVFFKYNIHLIPLVIAAIIRFISLKLQFIGNDTKLVWMANYGKTNFFDHIWDTYDHRRKTWYFTFFETHVFPHPWWAWFKASCDMGYDWMAEGPFNDWFNEEYNDFPQMWVHHSCTRFQNTYIWQNAAHHHFSIFYENYWIDMVEHVGGYGYGDDYLPTFDIEDLWWNNWYLWNENYDSWEEAGLYSDELATLADMADVSVRVIREILSEWWFVTEKHEFFGKIATLLQIDLHYVWWYWNIGYSWDTAFFYPFRAIWPHLFQTFELFLPQPFREFAEWIFFFFAATYLVFRFFKKFYFWHDRGVKVNGAPLYIFMFIDWLIGTRIKAGWNFFHEYDYNIIFFPVTFMTITIALFMSNSYDERLAWRTRIKYLFLGYLSWLSLFIILLASPVNRSLGILDFLEDIHIENMTYLQFKVFFSQERFYYTAVIDWLTTFYPLDKEQINNRYRNHPNVFSGIEIILVEILFYPAYYAIYDFTLETVIPFIDTNIIKLEKLKDQWTTIYQASLNHFITRKNTWKTSLKDLRQSDWGQWVFFYLWEPLLNSEDCFRGFYDVWLRWKGYRIYYNSDAQTLPMYGFRKDNKYAILWEEKYGKIDINLMPKDRGWRLLVTDTPVVPWIIWPFVHFLYRFPEWWIFYIWEPYYHSSPTWYEILIQILRRAFGYQLWNYQDLWPEKKSQYWIINLKHRIATTNRYSLRWQEKYGDGSLGLTRKEIHQKFHETFKHETWYKKMTRNPAIRELRRANSWHFWRVKDNIRWVRYQWNPNPRIRTKPL